MNLSNLIAGTVSRPATLHKFSADAGHNEFITSIMEADSPVPTRIDSPEPAPPRKEWLYEPSHTDYCHRCSPTLAHGIGREEVEMRFAKALREFIRYKHFQAYGLPLKGCEQDDIREAFERAAIDFAQVWNECDTRPFCKLCGDGTMPYPALKDDPSTGTKGHRGGWACQTCGELDEHKDVNERDEP